MRIYSQQQTSKCFTDWWSDGWNKADWWSDGWDKTDWWSDGWDNRKMKKIILLEFKRTTDYSESYYRDMRRVEDQQHTPIITWERETL